MAIYNPFHPSSPVPPESFSGRTRELERIARALFQTACGSPQNLLITGESGIGKTSLAYIAKAVAEKRLVLDKSERRAPVHTIYFSVQNQLPLSELWIQLLAELSESLALTYGSPKFLREFLDSHRRGEGPPNGTEGKGSEFRASEITMDTGRILRQLAHHLSKTKTENGPNSLCLILDNADRIEDLETFSRFWTSLQEKLSADNCRNLLLILAGLPGLKTGLMTSRSGFFRSLFPISLDKFTEDEAKSTVHRALERGIPRKRIHEDALEKLIYYSENYPFLIQEFGYSAFEISRGDLITLGDLERGIQGSELYSGSMQRLGEVFFSNDHQTIQYNESFRELLKIMAEKSAQGQCWIPRKSILERYSRKTSSLGQNLQQLVDKGLLQRNKDKFGEYRLVSPMIRVYIDKILTHS